MFRNPKAGSLAECFQAKDRDGPWKCTSRVTSVPIVDVMDVITSGSRAEYQIHVVLVFTCT